MKKNKINQLIISAVLFFSNLTCFSAINGDTIKPLPIVNKKFLIVAHIVLDDKNNTGIDSLTIKANIASLIPFWAPIGVSFELCKIVIQPNYRYNVLNDTLAKEMLDNFVIPDRINIFYVDSIKAASGKASLGGIAQKSGVGIYMEKSGIGSIIHEMGHYWGLKHTFDSSIPENPDHSNCATAGDEVCDTPFDPFIDKVSVSKNMLNNKCIFIDPSKDAMGKYHDPFVFNIMSYYRCSGGGCRNFTNGQYERMVKTYLTNTSKW